ELLRQAGVGGLPDQDMGEAEGVLARAQRLGRTEQAPPDERAQAARDARADGIGGQLRDRARGEDRADDGGPLDRDALVVREPVEPRCEERLDRRRDAAARAALLAEHRDELLQEERVAGGADDDLLELRLVALACEVADEQAALLVAQDRQRDGVEAGPAGPRLEQVRPDEAAEEDRRRAAPAGEVLEQVEERRLGPVDVVEEDHQRLPLRERLEQAAHGPEDLLRRRVRVREPEQAGEALPHELAVLGRGEQPDELLTRPPGRLGGLEPGGLSNDLD